MKISLLLGFIFMVSVQPIIMIGLLVSVVIFYSLKIYYESMSFWYGYILILILLSGVLVIFTYIVSLFPNESFEYFGLLMIFFLIFFFILETLYMMSMSQSLVSMLLWEGIMGGYLIYLTMFLLSIMVMVIFLSCVSYGALRVYKCAW